MKYLLGLLVALTLTISGVAAHTANAQSMNNFRIPTYDIQYELSKDADNHSVLKTTEKVTANFVNPLQNHGLVRAIPTKFDGHSTKLSIDSVTDENGNDLKYSAEQQGDMKVLQIGDPDTFIQGLKVYEITYTQHDVTRFYQDTTRDEWYWDTNGTEWKVPIDLLTVTANISKDLQSSMDIEPSCYQGWSGSASKCEVKKASDGVYTVSANGLNAGQNVTMAYGFKQGTFSQYMPTFYERWIGVWSLVQLFATIIAFILLVILSIQLVRKYNRKSELEIIVTEYIPPKHTSVLISSQVLTAPRAAFSAQLIDFAVRHYIEIIETKSRSFFTAAQYDIKIITDPTGLHAEEQEILIDMFDVLPKVGDRLALKSLRNNNTYFQRTMDNDKKIRALVEGEYALREKNVPVTRYFYRWSLALLIASVLALSPAFLVLAVIIALFGALVRPLTDKGLELRRYLLGLDKYIKAAETERLKFLQGPDTAEKVGQLVDVNNQGQLVKLYERVLPYAILFGREKEWAKRLGDFYQAGQSSPDWYSGTGTFNAIIFASAVSSFSAAASYGGGASSSSGGSSGGGYSGGGGGGGGGGGF